ncbi:JDVT-CTERM system glutamic-type intramembrane protease MrtJ [Sphaerochaeta sp.]|uniref:JDVT-CTERM system glutamic-type intramembrane protease MrtJ n=1 Tax=Sphaerochaeta sp. TaxID=1972642 RepID=UPI003D09786E
MIVVFFILAPVAEELFFRGFLQNWLKKRITAIYLGVSAANVATSVLFAGVHMVGWGAEHGFMVFAPSLLIGILYDRTGRVSFAIFLHSIYNLNAAVV